MAVWLCTGNPEKWPGNANVNGFLAMRKYLEKEHVYWATPSDLQSTINIDDAVYIWRTKSNSTKSNGIVATGLVFEHPKIYDGNNAHAFEFPDALLPEGWSENKATSSLKTGIRITRDFWNAPVYIDSLFVRRSMNHVGIDQQRAIEAAFEAS